MRWSRWRWAEPEPETETETETEPEPEPEPGHLTRTRTPDPNPKPNSNSEPNPNQVGRPISKTIDAVTACGNVNLVHEDVRQLDADYATFHEIVESGLFRYVVTGLAN